MADAAILDFRNFKFLTVGVVKRVELRHHAKFRSGSDCVYRCAITVTVTMNENECGSKSEFVVFVNNIQV